MLPDIALVVGSVRWVEETAQTLRLTIAYLQEVSVESEIIVVDEAKCRATSAQNILQIVNSR